MPLINLIEEQRLAVKRAEQKARSFFLLFVGTAMASLVGFGFTVYEGDKLQDEEASLRANIQKVAPLIKQIEDNEKQRRELEPRLKTLEDARLVTQRWDRILNHVTVQTPSNVWLTNVRCIASDPTQPIAINFAGIGAAQEPIGEFILRMQNSEDLENINLKFTQEKLVDQTKAIEFQFEGSIIGSAEAKIVTEEEKSE